jgi:energy-coupling factor transporter ATP-binding protein EcfA2
MTGLWEVPETRAKSPYPGLRPFGAKEWNVFFGREQMIREVLLRLDEQKMVVVHGTSGCGKSSLITAGVLLQLTRQQARLKRVLRIGTFRPGGQPMDALTELLSTLLTMPGKPVRIDDLEAALDGCDPRGSLARLAGEAGIDRLCIVIDQFEELFRIAEGQGKGEADRFAGLLVQLCAGYQPEEPWWEVGREAPPAKTPPAEISFILTMRSEFLGDCARYPGLAEVINLTQYLLPCMDRDNLIRAIREPAEVFGCRVERALAERLADDALREKDSLPLIQHALMLMWRAMRKRESKVLATDDYFGALADSRQPPEMLSRSPLGAILAGHADRVLRKIVSGDSEVEEAIEFIFRALTTTDREGRGVRDPQRLDRLCQISRVAAEDTRGIIDSFRGEGVSFLMPYQGEDVADSDTIDISHEALIRTWPKMNDERLDDAAGAPLGWIQRETQDGLTWRWLAIHARGRKHLNSATVERLKPWSITILKRPEWARRHLVRREGREHVSDEPEWCEVKQLVDSSARRADRLHWARRVVTGIALVAVILLFLGWQTQRAATVEVAAKSRTTQSQLNNQVTELQRRLAFLENESPAATERVSNQAVGQAPRIGQSEFVYIWVGTSSSIYNVADMEGRPVRAPAIRPFTRYRLLGNTVARNGFPQGEGRMARQRGAFGQGTVVYVSRVEPVAVGRRIDYWAMVRRQGIVVHLYAPRGPDPRAIRLNLQRHLAALGYDVDLNASPVGPEQMQAMHCRPEDQAGATRLAERVSRWFGLNYRSLGDIAISVAEGMGSCAGVGPGDLILMVDFLAQEPPPPPVPAQPESSSQPAPTTPS